MVDVLDTCAQAWHPATTGGENRRRGHGPRVPGGGSNIRIGGWRIKVLDPEVSTRLVSERFHSRVDVSSNLSHPHMVPIFSAGEVDGLFLLRHAVVEGNRCGTACSGERKLPLEDALHIAQDVADALAFAHAQGIIHRDIKPRTTLSGTTRSCRLGIARAISAAGSLTLTQGWPADRSPPAI